MKVVFLCVNYNTYEQTNNYLKSLDEASAEANVDVTVVVADNSDKVDELSKDYNGLNVKHIITNSNLGYFNAIRYCVQKSGIKISDYDYCVISNVDLYISKDFFINLCSKKYPMNIGCIAPSIWSQSEAKDRNPKILSRPSKRKLIALKYMYSIPIIFDLYTKLIYRNRKPVKYQNGIEIYAPHGSFMLFTKQAAGFIQNINYKSFLFCEENYVGENLEKSHLKTIYDSDLKIIDSDHASTGMIHRKIYYTWNKEAISNLLEDYYNE